MTESAQRIEVDARQLTITTAIVAAAQQRLGRLAEGNELDLLIGSAPGIMPDLEAWSRFAGHGLTLVEEGEAGTRVRLRKGEGTPNDHRVAMVVSKDGLLELLSPLGFALAAAQEGAQVSIYIQGPAVHVLRPGFSPTLPWPMRPFSVFARPRIEASGHVAPIEKLRQVQELGGRIYACGPSLTQFGVDPANLLLADVTVCEYLTFMEVMQSSDVQLYP